MHEVDRMNPLAPVDFVLDRVGLPEISPIVEQIAPKTIFRKFGIPTPDDLSDRLMIDIKRTFKL